MHKLLFASYGSGALQFQTPPKADEKANANQPPAREVVLVDDYKTAQFGDFKLIKSGYKWNREWTRVSELDPSLDKKNVWIRARLHTVRAKGKSAFCVLRQQTDTAQAVLFASDDIPRAMVKYVGKVPAESIVDVFGTVSVAPKPIKSTTQSLVELQVLKFYVVSAAARVLPLQIADAMRPEPNSDDEEETKDVEEKKNDRPLVGRSTRLDNRWIDLRVPCNNAIFRVQAGVGRYFREYFQNKDFVEVHSPKIIGTSSEGGAEVFRLKYFGKPACLAQSPQLYKQMCICSDFKGVFEIGPVFRAENSNTNRHLCEFTGLDFEMEIVDHYDEVLEVLWGVFIYIFDNLNKHCKKYLDTINTQYPFEPLRYKKEKLIFKFADAIKMLNEAGYKDADPNKDLSTPHEKAFGKIVREKYGVDFYIIDKYPMAARPFYTMPDANDPNWSNSYDVFLRGEEITSGAQRVHDVELLKERALAQNPPIPLHTLADYINSFAHGAPPHGGAGIGLERVVMLFCGLPNIRKTSLFPRDPKRFAP